MVEGCRFTSNGCLFSLIVLFVHNLASVAKGPKVKDAAAAQALNYADMPVSQIRKVIFIAVTCQFYSI